MNSNISPLKLWPMLGACLALMLIVTSNSLAQYDNPGIIPPNAHAYGMTYGEWSAEWWKWAYSMPINYHPLYDNTGQMVDCSTGQSGKVWFLGGTYTPVPVPGGATGNPVRSCTVPTGTALFFPVINSEAATLEGDDPDNQGYSALRAKAKSYQDHATNLYATVDGMPVQNLQGYRVQTPDSVYGPLPVNSITCNGFAPTGTDCTNPASDPFDTESSPFVGDGVYLMLPPLSVGTHTITFGGQVIFSMANGDPFDFMFTLDAIYYITVAPGKKK